MSPAILFEDNHCLAVLKPAGVLTIADETGDPSLHAQCCDYLRTKYRKPGRVFLGVVHRLDRPVGGVVLFARTSKAAARLSEQFRAHQVRKVYWALVEREIVPAAGRLRDWLVKDHSANCVMRVPSETPLARECLLDYRTLSLMNGRALVEVVPQTGRSHQIRVQLAAHAPIVGDLRYGAHTRAGREICLYARELTFLHPVRREPITVTAPSPAWAGTV